jgi:tRNA pseudouridine38-40 synthase
MRLALGLQYDGSAFSGWQTQPNGQTVQDHLENALYQFMGDPQLPPVKTTTAGRTDTGVHALGQVVHFDTDIVRPDASWVRGVNSFLPKSMSVQWVKPISADFDARYLAFERTYCYALFTGQQSAPLLTGRAGYLMLPKDQHLNIAAMQEAAKCLIGEHDFSSFRSSECQSKSPIKTIYQIDIHQDGPWVYFVFRGNAFLHHMVRNLVGSLLAVGQDKEPATWLKQVLDARSRQMAAPTFMADGLYLVRVGYPEHFEIPEPQIAASLLPTNLFTSYKKVI